MLVTTAFTLRASAIAMPPSLRMLSCIRCDQIIKVQILRGLVFAMKGDVILPQSKLKTKSELKILEDIGNLSPELQYTIANMKNDEIGLIGKPNFLFKISPQE